MSSSAEEITFPVLPFEAVVEGDEIILSGMLFRDTIAIARMDRPSQQEVDAGKTESVMGMGGVTYMGREIGVEERYSVRIQVRPSCGSAEMLGNLATYFVDLASRRQASERALLLSSPASRVK